MYSILLRIILLVGISSLWLSPLHAQEQIALILQVEKSNYDFINAVYSGASHASGLYNYSMGVHELALTGVNPKKWFKELLKKQPKALIIMDTAVSPHTQILIDEALRKNIPIGVVNADLNKPYFGTIFRVGSEKVAEGQMIGEYLKRFSEPAPLCISFLDAWQNDFLRCQGLANGFEKTIYQMSSNGGVVAIEKGVFAFLEHFPQAQKIIITDNRLLEPLLKVRQKAKRKQRYFTIGFVGRGGNSLNHHLLKGNIDFMVNDQPWFQGYWAVSSLVLTDTFRVKPQELVAAGSVVVDRKVAQRVFSGQNLKIKVPGLEKTVKKRYDDALYPGIPALKLKK